ncbi:MAG: isoprenylcysteine carboxylmethyltransferase family protein [Candidatus Marinimicrobia bacterium]|jgi:protein-S-isoprenylcysteine O-methyltransferase Ste14|nr:isoprenylcysteine carboxylmethyltransferase family protein [Candidatus Neomarinimicrobiota bacterium]|tara:strand:- start:4794 stop:5297 length:504 start_codon:yes stop_codon:yes gene_type:complete
MDKESNFKRIFCVGPIGVAITFFVWCAAVQIETALGLPTMKIHPTFKTILLTVFLVDAAYLIVGSSRSLPVKERGRTLITKGPFKYIRHPLYSAIIYSATGALALWRQSWVLLVSVLPIAFLWSWLVGKEERYMLELFGEKYKNYQTKTGQFLPSWKTIKHEAEEIE